ncbi:uncharacterized protein PAC_14303 [Phialocephala subalpina]|uniref:Mid2 domain-containing protein n=1 Tax=Phialocephala subalpina TaxID=576137 RepID=A0A1L7XH78_9HELO|nr:uncharacterized protein PAC_14303 [Phialocephala subalpina]
MFCHNPSSQFISWVFLVLLFSLISSQKTIQQIIWNVPDGNLSDLSQTFTAGQTLPLSWNSYASTQYVDTTKNLVDLWVAAFDFNLNPFSQRVTIGVNLTSPGNFAWTIAIPDSNLTISAKYVLRFKVTSPVFNPNSGDLSSPGFLVLRAAGASTVSSSIITTTSARSTAAGTSSSTNNLPASSIINTSALTPAASTATSSTSTSPPAAPSSGLSAGAKVGIGAGVAIGALALAGLSYFFFFVRRQKQGPEAVGSGNAYPSKDYKSGPIVDGGPTEMPAKMVVAELPVNRYQ